MISRSAFRLCSRMPFAWMIAAFAALSTPALAAPTDAGKYQLVLGDCEGCHGKNLAGGVVLMTPFGKMVTPNITPDKDTGIGNYSAEDFRQAMKNGIAPRNKLLYPAMPYPSYARMSDADIAALWTYMRSVKPVRNSVNVNQLHFPFNLRFMMRGWNLLFFAPAPYANNPAKSAAWNRGAYLVSGAAHCGACHTPKNPFGADKGAALTGAALQGWFAPDLTSDKGAGLGTWSAADIVEYLQTGRNNHSLASGPMAEAVENSTSRMNGTDLKAIAVYLKNLPPSRGNGGGATGIEAQMKSGAALYDVSCAACHGRDGKGSLIFPPLAGNPTVRQVRADSIVRMVLAGGRGAATARAPTGPGMPSFAWRLSDSQAADILTYVRNNWGNRAPAVSPETVGHIRSALHSSS
ncbi:MAG: cytochrome c [Alphaproteobacteria bacterium]|nr:cytochrome c [Alphaproteobacteria bacterium]